MAAFPALTSPLLLPLPPPLLLLVSLLAELYLLVASMPACCEGMESPATTGPFSMLARHHRGWMVCVCLTLQGRVVTTTSPLLRRPLHATPHSNPTPQYYSRTNGRGWQLHITKTIPQMNIFLLISNGQRDPSYSICSSRKKCKLLAWGIFNKSAFGYFIQSLKTLPAWPPRCQLLTGAIHTGMNILQ